ncbi:MAG TPA: ComEC/Rec2 family competence protein [Candidatus Krumholzibacteria bacterium]|nr:ComEC/Rec2 family competence protein [Candidatus Krumholzibacteria bacterium]HPD71598.1 ComEC/Rec2 family competence protein [Candidatus Krumholzibacteria bacterium]HRY41469.1 ComEC/Rec2 family competence protein [Candidatus Krumholzibacteria bacterium]
MPWAGLLLLLPSVGRQWPVAGLPVDADTAVRIAALVPPIAAAVPARARAAGWLVTAGLALLVGALDSGERPRRPPALAASDLAASRWNRAGGLGVLRLTARPRESAPGQWTAPAVLLEWTGSEPPIGEAPRPGESVLLRARGAMPTLGAVVGGPLAVQPPRWPAVRGGYDEAGWLIGRGIAWVGRTGTGDSLAVARADGPLASIGAAQSRAQASVRGRLAGALPPREADLAGAVLLGGGTTRPVRESFARLGLAHLFSLSGLHVGIVSGLVLCLLRPFARAPARQLPLVVPLLVGYAVLVDVPGSVVRAVGLVVLALIVRAAGREVDSLRLLGLLLWANLLWQPAAVADAGLRLSYLAAGGIVVGQRLVSPVVRAWRRGLRWLAGAFSVSFSAQIATMPVLAEHFGYLPLAGPLVNVVVVPLFGIASFVLAGGLLLAAVWPWAGEALLACAWLLLRPLQAAAAVAGPALSPGESGLPVWGPLRLAGYAALVAGLVFAWRLGGRWRWPIAAAIVGLLPLVAGAWPPRSGAPVVAARQFAVEQGDCALVRLPDGWTCLIDTGDSWPGGGGPLARDVLPALRRLGIRRLDAVCLTHGHDDHVGGVADLAAALPVGRWLVGGEAMAPADAETVARPAGIDTLHAAGEWAFVCYAPAAAREARVEENDRSLALGLCRRGRLHALWSGDLEAGGEAMLLPMLPPVTDRGISFWKAGHHGSRTSGSAALLAALRPQLVVISCGVANRHRHPSHEPFPGATVARTDLHGTVSLEWRPDGALEWRRTHGAPAAPAASP